MSTEELKKIFLERKFFRLDNALSDQQLQTLNKEYRHFEDNSMMLFPELFGITDEPQPNNPAPQPQPPANILRWFNEFLPLTWSVNWAGAPTRLAQHDMREAMERVFQEFTMFGLSFKYVETGGTLAIGFKKVDGAGGTLAFVYQPSQGTNMGSCGGACGDYWFDNEEPMTLLDFENVFRHETGHAIGMDHTETGVMAPYYNFGTPRTTLDNLVIDYISRAYPYPRPGFT